MKKQILGFFILGAVFTASAQTTNIYNSNGTLTANRTVTMNGKNIYFVESAGSGADYGFSVNGTNGKVGIGTLNPSTKFEVINAPVGGTSNYAYFGLKTPVFPTTLPISYMYDSGLYIRQITQPTGEIRTRLQSVEPGARSNSVASAGFIEFNPATTSNEGRGALNFGFGTTEFMRLGRDGVVRIADGGIDLQTPEGYKLYVEQGILTEKVKVALKTTTDWADYVFDADYKLMPLDDVESYTKDNKHLPNIPSAAEMVKNGLNVAEMDAKLLEKIEELTLYLIQQQKQIEDLKAKVENLQLTQQK